MTHLLSSNTPTTCYSTLCHNWPSSRGLRNSPLLIVFKTRSRTYSKRSFEQEEHIAYFPDGGLFSPLQRRHGLPIGNLTSHLWGNYYLNHLDHLVKEKLLRRTYLRYVDDFAIFGHSKEELRDVKYQIEVFLKGYRLLLLERESRIYRCPEGVIFLGYRFFLGSGCCLRPMCAVCASTPGTRSKIILQTKSRSASSPRACAVGKVMPCAPTLGGCGGGSSRSFWNVPRNSVPGKKVPRNSVPGKNVPRNSVPGKKAPRNSVPGKKVARNSVPRKKAPRNRVPGYIEALATRKPTLLFLLFRLFLLRLAERQLLSLLFHEPPRNTALRPYPRQKSHF